jgi:hypothetical protein
MFNLPTGLPASMNELVTQYGLKTGTKEYTIAEAGIKQQYLNKAKDFLEATVNTGKGSGEDAALLFKQIGDLLEGGYYGERLPLFDAVRRASAQEWLGKGYTDVSADRTDYPFIYNQFFPADYYEKTAAWSPNKYGKLGVTGGFPRTPQPYTPPAPITSRYTAGQGTAVYRPSEYNWNWRALAPPTRWLTY